MQTINATNIHQCC